MNRKDLERRLANMRVADVLDEVILDVQRAKPTSKAVHKQGNVLSILYGHRRSFPGKTYSRNHYPRSTTFEEYKILNRTRYTYAIDCIQDAIDYLGVKV